MTDPLRIAIQLCTLAPEMTSDRAGTLARLSEIGYEVVEAYSFADDAARYRADLDAAGLSAPIGHAPLVSREIVFPDGRVVTPPPLEQALEAAATVGCDTIIDPYTSPDRWGDSDSIKRTAELLNEASVKAHEFGLAVGYHNHGHEIADVDGTPGLELLATHLSEDVSVEVDTQWVAVAGADPTTLLPRLGDRVIALHLKDWLYQNDPYDQRALGEGELPIADFINAAPSARYAVFELVRFPGDRWAAAQSSFSFLQNLGVSQ